ncbi:hypothetical protein ES703_119582 [subsurface metagenome]
MINTMLNGMITLMLTKFMLNDVPHAMGFTSERRRLGKPKTEAERSRVHERFYGTKKTPVRGTGLKERGEPTEGRRFGEPKTESERRMTHFGKYGTIKTPKRGQKFRG